MFVVLVYAEEQHVLKSVACLSTWFLKTKFVHGYCFHLAMVLVSSGMFPVANKHKATLAGLVV